MLDYILKMAVYGGALGVIVLIQAVLNVGSFDIDDVIMNILGTLIGYLLATLIKRTKRTLEPDRV